MRDVKIYKTDRCTSLEKTAGMGNRSNAAVSHPFFAIFWLERMGKPCFPALSHPFPAFAAPKREGKTAI